MEVRLSIADGYSKEKGWQVIFQSRSQGDISSQSDITQNFLASHQGSRFRQETFQGIVGNQQFIFPFSEELNGQTIQYNYNYLQITYQASNLTTQVITVGGDNTWSESQAIQKAQSESPKDSGKYYIAEYAQYQSVMVEHDYGGSWNIYREYYTYEILDERVIQEVQYITLPEIEDDSGGGDSGGGDSGGGTTPDPPISTDPSQDFDYSMLIYLYPDDYSVDIKSLLEEDKQQEIQQSSWNKIEVIPHTTVEFLEYISPYTEYSGKNYTIELRVNNFYKKISAGQPSFEFIFKDSRDNTKGRLNVNITTTQSNVVLYMNKRLEDMYKQNVFPKITYYPYCQTFINYGYNYLCFCDSIPYYIEYGQPMVSKDRVQNIKLPIQDCKKGYNIIGPFNYQTIESNKYLYPCPIKDLNAEYEAITIGEMDNASYFSECQYNLWDNIIKEGAHLRTYNDILQPVTAFEWNIIICYINHWIFKNDKTKFLPFVEQGKECDLENDIKKIYNIIRQAYQKHKKSSEPNMPIFPEAETWTDDKMPQRIFLNIQDYLNKFLIDIKYNLNNVKENY